MDDIVDIFLNVFNSFIASQTSLQTNVIAEISKQNNLGFFPLFLIKSDLILWKTDIYLIYREVAL